MTVAYDPSRTAFVLVDPYNGFFADDGKIYPRLREVAQAVGHLVKDPTAATSAEHLRAAIELNGPIYAEHVLTTADVFAALKG